MRTIRPRKLGTGGRERTPMVKTESRKSPGQRPQRAPAGTCGVLWKTCGCPLRIRRLGVRIPPSAPAAGFEVLPIFVNPWHFSVVLPDAMPSTFDALRECSAIPCPIPATSRRSDVPLHGVRESRADRGPLGRPPPGVRARNRHGPSPPRAYPARPHPGDYVVVGDDEVPPALALVVSREPDGTIPPRILDGSAASHDEFATRHLRTLA